MRGFRNAFTFVEMLVSIVLLTLLIGIAVFSFRQQLLSISKLQESGLSDVLRYAQIRSSIESIKFYAVDRYDNVNRPMKQVHHFFYGSKEQMRYITTSPILSDDIALAALECVGDTLLYTEEPLYFQMDFLRPEFGEDPKRHTFYKDLEHCSFTYIYDEKVYEDFRDEIPDKILIRIQEESKPKEIYTSVKSDANTTRFGVYSRMYDEF